MTFDNNGVYSFHSFKTKNLKTYFLMKNKATETALTKVASRFCDEKKLIQAQS